MKDLLPRRFSAAVIAALGFASLRGYYPAGFLFRNKTGGQLTAPTLTQDWKEVRPRSRLDHDF